MSDALGLGLGSAGFVDRHGLYSDEQARAVTEVAARIEQLGLRTVRLVLVDQHGIARSKHVSGAGAIAGRWPSTSRSSEARGERAGREPEESGD